MFDNATPLEVAFTAGAAVGLVVLILVLIDAVADLRVQYDDGSWTLKFISRTNVAIVLWLIIGMTGCLVVGVVAMATPTPASGGNTCCTPGQLSAAVSFIAIEVTFDAIAIIKLHERRTLKARLNQQSKLT